MEGLEAMIILNKVVETGSFSRAAEQLDIAKSSVSKKIRALEEQMGVILVQRSTRQLKVTEEGWKIYQHSQRMLNEYQSAQQLAASFRDRPSGRLKVSAPPLFGRYCLAPLMPQFQRNCPEVLLDLFFTEQYSELIGEGFDVSLRIGQLTDSDLVQVPLCRIKAVCCAAPGYVNRTQVPREPSDLTQHQCLVWQPAQNSPKQDWPFQYGGRSADISVPSAILSNDHEAIKGMVLEEGGITVLPDYAIKEELATGRLIPLLEDYPLPNFPVSLLYPKRQNIPAKTRAFVEYLKGNLVDVPLLQR